ncbi:hypothetical protein A28LD_2081 [Idiomarina sp. A28L]|uniref:hypothetical protein n=1 Tax=Idiomarina sp. A28L TaxID=1036674 RepID=UPI0002138AE6|nr:hypothetical protein [Idiomarina sp. A28L]EGN74298.1 hypothetical protein A28LD_2081 [Idiomarina sp. A28L]
MTKTYLSLLAASCCALMLTACSDKMENVEYSDDPAELAAEHNNQVTSDELSALAAEIFRLVGTPEADNPSQCKVLPFGAKPCGGPANWLVYSTKVTDTETLEERVELYNMLSSRFNEQEELVGDCAVVTEVQPNVVQGICVASPLADM